MTSGLLGMDFSSVLTDAAYHLKCSTGDIEMFSWPESFSSTCGPRHGIGGQAFTAFQVYAFRDGSLGEQKGVKYCSGVRQEWNGEMQEPWRNK